MPKLYALITAKRLLPALGPRFRSLGEEQGADCGQGGEHPGDQVGGGEGAGRLDEFANVHRRFGKVLGRIGLLARGVRHIAAIEGDSVVREVIDTFDASIVESSIKPVV